MDPRPALNHKDSGNHTFDRLILDPNSNFEELIPVDEDFLKDYMVQLSDMNVDTEGGQALSQPQQNVLPSRTLSHQTSLQRHQTLLLQQQAQQHVALQASQAAQIEELKRVSGDGLQSDPYGSGGFSAALSYMSSRQGSGGSAQGYAASSADFAGRPPLAPQGDVLGSGSLRTESAPANYAEQQQQYGQQPGAFGAGGLEFGGAPPGGLHASSAGSAYGGIDLSAGFTQLVGTGQQQPGQVPPNLVISPAPMQPEFGGGAPGGPGRVANQRIVLATGSTPPDSNQYGLGTHGPANGGSQYASPQAHGSMAPPPARSGGYGTPTNPGSTYERLAGPSARTSPAGGPHTATSGGSDDPSDPQYQDDGDDMEGEDGQQPQTKNRRHRTLRQQMLNKQAQQRYRERKKAKANELEHTVAALTEQLNAMECVKEENADLQDKNLALVSQLRAREEELERLLREQAAQPAYMKTNSGRVLEVPKTDDGPTTQQELEELSSTYQSTVRELREILQGHGLENREGADINGASAPEAQLQRLAELVETVNNIHSRALRMEGAHTAGLVSASVERSSGRHDTNRRWAEAARSMRFTQEQTDKVLSVRREHLRRLHRIYEDRRQINLEAISVLLPQERGGSAPSMSMERAKSWLPSMFHRSKHASRQKDVMKKLRDNLSEEQRLASELDYLVFRRILTPVQGAWFVVLKYPAYCDSLSLCNGVAEIHGQVDVDM